MDEIHVYQRVVDEVPYRYDLIRFTISREMRVVSPWGTSLVFPRGTEVIIMADPLSVKILDESCNAKPPVKAPTCCGLGRGHTGDHHMEMTWNQDK